MSNLYPPILASRRTSIQKGWPGQPGDASNFYIYFTMPLSVNTTDIGHVQVLIQQQLTLNPWSNQGSSLGRHPSVPERDVIYLPGTKPGSNPIHNAGGLMQIDGDLWVAKVPQDTIRGQNSTGGGDSGVPRGFPAGLEDKGETFIVQIRFGDDVLGFSTSETFAGWKQNQIKNSAFGEWSNTQRMFVYETSPNIIGVDAPDHPIAELSWSYNPVSIDPLEQVRITYSWSTPDDDGYGNNIRARNLDIKSNDAMGAAAAGHLYLNVMRIVPIKVTIHFITVNNTVFIYGDNDSFIIQPIIPTLPVLPSGKTSSLPIIGEEIEDGVLGMTFSWDWPIIDSPRYMIYRGDLRTLEAIKLEEILPTISEVNPHITSIKDYSIEMGGEYLYLCFGFDNDTMKVIHSLSNNNMLTPSNWKPHLHDGYNRQMNFHGNTFLTTRWQQLKLAGNVTVNNFNRNVSDQFTTTIGGAYPFYSRSAQFNYRTLSLQAAITLELDSTNTFLDFRYQLNSPNSEFSEWMGWALDLYQEGMKELDPNEIGYQAKVEQLQIEYYARAQLIFKGINPTTGNSFLQGSKPFWMDGQLWLQKGLDDRKLVLRSNELYTDAQISLSMKRIQDAINLENESFVRASDDSTGFRRGPSSIFDEAFHRDATDVRHSIDRPSERIYAERKFRDSVMEWATNGQPKLFRSETEGNMIVMLSGVSFSPLMKNRNIYSMSATVTEIAEYNLENLILYGLVPVQFSAFYLPGVEFGFIPGEEDINI